MEDKKMGDFKPTTRQERKLKRIGRLRASTRTKAYQKLQSKFNALCRRRDLIQKAIDVLDSQLAAPYKEICLLQDELLDAGVPVEEVRHGIKPDA
jgi:hypothetical protein